MGKRAGVAYLGPLFLCVEARRRERDVVLRGRRWWVLEVAEKYMVDAMSMALQRLRSYVEPYRAILLPQRVDWDRLPF